MLITDTQPTPAPRALLAFVEVAGKAKLKVFRLGESKRLGGGEPQWPPPWHQRRLP